MAVIGVLDHWLHPKPSFQAVICLKEYMDNKEITLDDRRHVMKAVESGYSTAHRISDETRVSRYKTEVILRMLERQGKVIKTGFFEKQSIRVYIAT